MNNLRKSELLAARPHATLKRLSHNSQTSARHAFPAYHPKSLNSEHVPSASAFIHFFSGSPPQISGVQCPSPTDFVEVTSSQHHSTCTPKPARTKAPNGCCRRRYVILWTTPIKDCMVLAADPEQSGSGVFGYGKLTRYTLLPYFKFCDLFITGWSTLWQDISLVFLYIVLLSGLSDSSIY
jgi:hypothetical protein